MAFIVEQMTLADEARIYQGPDKEVIQRFARVDLSRTAETAANWVVDPQKKTCLLRARNKEVREPQDRYLFVLENHLVVMHVPPAYQPTARFLYVSESLASRMDEVKLLIAEAFRIGGRWCVGATEVDPMLVTFEMEEWSSR